MITKRNIAIAAPVPARFATKTLSYIKRTIVFVAFAGPPRVLAQTKSKTWRPEIIPITDLHNEYASSLVRQLQGVGVRASADLGSERMNAKIRAAQMMKVPYMLVVGDREVENDSVSLRRRDGIRHI